MSTPSEYLPPPKTICTHSGLFHADDVIATAIAHYCFPDYEIVRTRDSEIIKNSTIAIDVGKQYDVGKLRFDHHQFAPEECCRENGVPYASAGMVWRHFGPLFVEEVFRRIKRTPESVQGICDWIDEDVIQSVDRNDCGESLRLQDGSSQVSFGDFLRWMNPSMYDNKEPAKINEIFKSEAVPMAQLLIQQKVKWRISVIRSNRKIQGLIVPGQRYVVLPSNMPWREAVTDNIWYVIHPASSTTWGAYSVSEESSNFTRFPFPDWYNDGEYPDGVLFAHRSRHMCICDSRETAINVVESSIKMHSSS